MEGKTSYFRLWKWQLLLETKYFFSPPCYIFIPSILLFFFFFSHKKKVQILIGKVIQHLWWYLELQNTYVQFPELLTTSSVIFSGKLRIGSNSCLDILVSAVIKRVSPQAVGIDKHVQKVNLFEIHPLESSIPHLQREIKHFAVSEMYSEDKCIEECKAFALWHYSCVSVGDRPHYGDFAIKWSGNLLCQGNCVIGNGVCLGLCF